MSVEAEWYFLAIDFRENNCADGALARENSAYFRCLMEFSFDLFANIIHGSLSSMLNKTEEAYC